MRAGSLAVDVTELVTRLVEPALTVRVRELLAVVQRDLDAERAHTMEHWHNSIPLDSGVVGELRVHLDDLDVVRRQAARIARRVGGSSAPRDERPAEHFARIPPLLAHSAARPAVVSAILWHWFGAQDADFASHVIQVIRERAGLPGLRQRIAADEPARTVTSPDLPAHVAWFADRQVADACTWLEHVPPPRATTLAESISAIAKARDAAARIEIEDIARFLQRTASFFLHLATQKLDPLGFPLAREAQLDVDPTLEHRLELATWARRAHRLISPSGRMVVMSIPVQAPWSLQLELIAAEPGHGASGGMGLLLRLRGDHAPTPATRAPMLLCLPGESIEERGVRFERWLSSAYPHAVDTWRVWS